MSNSRSSSGWVLACLLPYLAFSYTEAAVQITSNAVGGSTHFLSDAAQHDATNSSPESALLRQGIIIIGGAPATEDKGKGVAGPTENITFNFGQVSLAHAQQKTNGTGVNLQPPATTSSSMTSYVPSGGLHPVAGGQAPESGRIISLSQVLQMLSDTAKSTVGNIR